MIIAGEISGIQRYLFDVAQEGGGQARSLRARSFFIQLLVEGLALQIQETLDWPEPLFCNAGKFLLQGAALNEAQQQAIAALSQGMNAWLLRETNAELRFSLVVQGGERTAVLDYGQATKRLARRKKRAWATAEGWGQLMLEGLREPCALCRRREATRTDNDDGERRQICERCYSDYEIGKKLPTAKFVVLSPEATNDGVAIGKWQARLTTELPQAEATILSLDGKKVGTAKPRRLARHIPTAQNRPLEFVALAQEAEGDALLGVLKMDGDQLGKHLARLLQNKEELDALAHFSHEMDEFFAAALMNLMQQPPWNLIYTVFSGGDDVFLIGPWNVVFDFAAEIQRKFHSQFNARGLTLSGAFSLAKPKRPLHLAAEQVEELLERAKEEPAIGAEEGRNQFAAFGQIWKWPHHQIIARQARQLTEWVRKEVLPRGWLQTLLRLSEMRLTSPLATSKLAYTVARNYPKVTDQNPDKSALRQWADALIDDFDRASRIETKYLSATIRYALTATRNVSKEENE